ncbi:ribosomal protein S18-alanine N-acetyltransferase [Bifidobacterium mongoliense]|uniref:Alanine acetyltransferase n=1 Tax=Bifidobacterium mongoliense DSM 21395 TaxID=1437603 RepID=A0A087C0H4_9BIFI|nr:ribosomal protein S18-alanine N-acetyltransferase [Bifidobacterium mongoliense]KFI76774.1 alanine acetyltransferase [Bifidobacterium mongoliense DSM 21395]
MIVDLNDRDRDEVVSRLAALERGLFGAGAWSEAMVREELEAPDRTYVLDVPDGSDAHVGSQGCDISQGPGGPTGDIRGYAGFWYGGDDAEIMTIGVAPEHQRRGIAAALLRSLIERATDRGARRMLLEVRVDNDPALALYRRFGFARMGLRRRYYQPENVDAYTMSLDLHRAMTTMTTMTNDEVTKENDDE